MPRLLKLEIIENLDELKFLSGQQKTAFDRERVQALYLLKLGQVKTVSQLGQL
jgi:putative transposase